MHQDFIPRPDAAFDAFFSNIVNYVLDNKARWGHVTDDDAYALEGQYEDWRVAWQKTLVPHIPQLTLEKNRVRVTTERALRAFINRFLRWPPVTDLDRDKMAIRNWDTNPTKQPVPTTVPEIEVDTSVIRQLSLRMRDFGASNWSKPEHVHGMELSWRIMKARPEHVRDLHNLESVTANPIVLTFEENERGERVFFAARWFNSTSHVGPWSDVESAVIP